MRLLSEVHIPFAVHMCQAACVHFREREGKNY